MANTYTIKNISTAASEALTLYMPTRATLMPRGQMALEKDGGWTQKYELEGADSSFPMSVVISIRPNIKDDVKVCSITLETVGVVVDADGNEIRRGPIKYVQTLYTLGATGLFNVAEVKTFLCNAWGLLFTDTSAGAMDSVVLNHLAANMPMLNATT